MNIDFYPNTVTRKIDLHPHAVQFDCENLVSLRITAYSPDIIRFRYATDGHFEEDFSYAVSSKFGITGSPIVVTETEKCWTVSTETLDIIVQKHDLKRCIKDKKGLVILEEEKGFHWEENHGYGGNIVKMSHAVQEGEHFYGLGDKTTHPNMRGRKFTNWGMDEYGFQKGTDPLYKNIPFFLGIHHHQAYGVFFDNTFKSHFDFASERRAVSSFWADGGEMNFYFIYGPALLDVSRRYTQITGVPELPPMWALGYHQCKWSYYPEQVVREVTTKMRELRIPCDAIYLDIDYMDGFRCFTWDLDKFPDPKGMVADLREQGYKTIVIIDPGIKVDEEYEVFQEALAQNYFCRRADGPLFKGKVWPGDCYFPDFTNPKVRKWWSGLFQDLIENIGVKGVWNDMNEPAVFEQPNKSFPEDVRHDYDGHPCSHRKAHNVYGMQMARATYKGVKKFSKSLRPFVITRSAYSGAQRYTSAWTGDNIASWEHLWVANVQAQRMSMTGFSFVGSDIGGFIEHPSPELYVRWIQLATFHAFMRTHSSGDHGAQEPWSFGSEALDIVRKFIELRYQLLPYLYTCFFQYVKQGTPMIWPIAALDQDDYDTLYRADEFSLGPHILSCPILEPNALGRYIYLPKGVWYCYWSDLMYEGGSEKYFKYTLDTCPMFIRAGAVIPMYPVMQYVGERAVEQLTLHIYHVNGRTESHLYEDAGDGYDYEKGVFNEKTFVVDGDGDGVTLRQLVKGPYTPSYQTYELVFHGIPAEVTSVSINGRTEEAWAKAVSTDKKLVVDAQILELKIVF